VISGGNVDMTNFKPGNSGVALGSPPLSQTQPQSPARIQEVELNEKIASLQRAMKIACDSPEDAGIQRQIDEAERQLKMLQREFALDRNAYYSKPNYADDTEGKAKLDAEQQQLDAAQSEIDRLTQKLAQQPQ
jgi:predicted  nucleic acid-binding Zn-ribbon protein